MEHHEHYPHPVSAPTLRRVAGTLATGVTIITVGSGRGLHGCVANAVTSVSLSPPTMLVCLGNQSRTRPELLDVGAFGINILADTLESRNLCTLFAGKEPHKFTNAPHRRLPSGVPVLNAAMSWMECRVVEVHESGDHTIVIGEVMAAEESPGDPLVFYRGQYASLLRHADVPSA